MTLQTNNLGVCSLCSSTMQTLIAFTMVTSSTYVTVGQVQVELIWKHIMAFRPQWRRHMLISVWCVDDYWAMEVNTTAREPLVQPSKDNDEPLTQAIPYSLQYSKDNSTLCTKLCGQSRICKQAGITWYSIHSSIRTTLFYPLVSQTHRCGNVTIWETCFPKTNHY